MLNINFEFKILEILELSEFYLSYFIFLILIN